jgi:NodT family efflux transporter outer membrane factor (OMF) lipoprotein
MANAHCQVRRTSPLKLTALASVSVWLAGCAVGPDYVRPQMEVPAAFKETSAWKVAEPHDAATGGDWWKVYRDPQLDSLMAQVDISNHNIKLAEAQYRQARALAQQARASFFPTVVASASATRANSRKSGGGTGNIANTYDVSLDAIWELDIWGAVRRSVEAGAANAQASDALLAAARLSAQAALAQDYFLLRVTDADKDLLNRTVDAYAKTLQLTQNQYAAGVVQRSDVVQAQSQLQSAQAQAIDVAVTRAQLEHAIALLVGKAPAVFALAPVPLPLKSSLPEVPAGLPSQLLERRPDVAAAERLVAAANARIGVVRAAYFPTLTLAASGSFVSRFAHWLTVPNRIWSIGPALAQTLFDGGLRRAANDQVVAAYDAQVETYKQTVLTAFLDVEDNLAAINYLGREAAVQDGAVRSAREAARLILNQYRAGTVSFINVLTAQTDALTAERTALQIQARRYTTNVLLIKALGGGWHTGAATAAQDGADRAIALAAGTR